MSMTLPGQTLKRHIENGDISAVISLLKAGNINLDERDADGQTFLMVACQHGEPVIIEEILSQGENDSLSEKPDVNAVDNDNWTAILNASKEGHHRIVESLLRHGADIEHRDVGGWTALMWACYKGRNEVARVLLAHGANCNVKGEHHMSCLTWAAGRGHTEIVRMLLDNGAKVNTADKYGTTPLVWACRRGHKGIVEMLLREHATVDNAGMNSQTALIMAAKGGYSDVVAALLEYNPNVNAVDKDGYSALTWAAKEGYGDIAYSVLQREAYVNLPDRFGDTILIYAVKGGHLEVVQSLLKKASDVDVQGVDEKTALYWAVEKGHVSIVKALLHYHASTEIANKDGDTPLMKAVRSKNTEIVERLVAHGAKVSAVDKKGDTSLHIAARGRSKRITEILLRNPKDSRLLYKPNKAGETPYHMDASHTKSILSQIFGARHLNAEDSIQGYDIYSSTIADVLSDPALRTPICVGLYAKWGSGKSFLIERLQKEMKSFTQHNADIFFQFSAVQFFICFMIAAITGVVLTLTLDWRIGLGVGLGVFAIEYITLGVIWFGSARREWRWADSIGLYIARKLQFLQLLLQVLFCNQPNLTDKDNIAVRFLFTNNARLASIVGEKSIMAMISTLSDALEEEYGTLVTRLFRVFKPPKAAENGRFKTVCCIPVFLIVLFVLTCVATGIAILCFRGVHDITKKDYTAEGAVLIGIAIIIGVALIGNCYTWARMLINIVISPRRRIHMISNKIDSISGMETVMQNLKHEVEWMGSMSRCMDSFLTTHTRLVVIVDGLDSCEQEKLLQVLDSVHMLFGDQYCPFITILAVDPHVIIKGIEHNLHGLFRDSSINGHDYLRNIVHLPFFLQPSLRTTRSRKDSVGSDTALNHSSKFSRDPSVSGSVGSLPEATKGFKRSRQRTSSNYGSGYGSGVLTRHPSTFDLTKSLIKDTYFSDINPRNMRRLMNIIAVTGRLLRAFNIDFSWFRLAAWINVTEQWPYRLSWIILEVEDDDEIDSSNTLRVIYDRVLSKIPISKDIDPLLEIDRNPRKLELFLSNYSPTLTVGDLRKFLQCTINVDPYLRKLIREMQQNVDNQAQEIGLTPRIQPPPGQPETLSTPQSGWSLRRGSANNLDSIHMASLSASLRRGSSSTLDPSHLGSFRAHTPARATPQPRHPYPGQFMVQAPYMMTPGQHFYSPHQMPTPSHRNRHRVHVKGGMSDISLENLSVPGVCDILLRLDGLNEEKIPEYQERLKFNNINGMVLYNCEMVELKGVMNMTFGDWELFKAMIENLREEHPDDISSNEAVSPHIRNFTQEMHSLSRLEQPQATKKVRPKREKSKSPEPGTSKVGRFEVRPVIQKRKLKGGGNELPGSKMDPSAAKKDTVMSEVLYETQAIQDAMEGLGMSDYEDTSDEEEEVRMKMLDVNQLSIISEESITAVEQYFQKLLTVEEEKMSMKSFETRDTSPRTTPRTSPTLSQPDRHSIHGTSGAPSVCSDADHCFVKMESADSALTAYSIDSVEPLSVSGSNYDRSDTYISQSSSSYEDVPLVQSKKGKVEKIGATLKNTLQKLDFTKSKDKLAEDESLLAASNDKTPLLTPATSREHLSVRKANQVADSSGPSAFRVVSPSKSREASLPGSKITSRESSVDNIRSIASVPDTPEHNAGQAIRMQTMISDSSADSSTTEPMSAGSAGGTSEDGCVLVSTDGKTYKLDTVPKDESFV